MKFYQIHFHEIFMNEEDSKNEKLVAAYNKLFDKLLDPHTISGMRIFESLNFLSSSMTSKPAVIEPLLRRKTLPHLFFLVCSN